MSDGLDLQTVKFVKITEVDKHGKHPVADIPITRPQKIRAYIDMGDLQPKNAENNDHGWRIAPELAAKVRDVLEDPIRLEQISKETTTPLDLLNAFHVLMYEITRNRSLALRAAKNSLDKEQATAEYEREVAAARDGKPQDDDEDDEVVPAPGTGKNYKEK
jgi:hypothetical protein